MKESFWTKLKMYAEKKERQQTPWYMKYQSSNSLSEEDKSLLSQFTEEEFCDMIPHEAKISLDKLYLYECVLGYKEYLKTGEWKVRGDCV